MLVMNSVTVSHLKNYYVYCSCIHVLSRYLSTISNRMMLDLCSLVEAETATKKELPRIGRTRKSPLFSSTNTNTQTLPFPSCLVNKHNKMENIRTGTSVYACRKLFFLKRQRV
jgi:hypothetical protein